MTHVVCFSGGADSAVLLDHVEDIAVKKHEKVIPLFVHYGQKCTQGELAAFLRYCGNNPHTRTLDLRHIWDGYPSALLEGGSTSGTQKGDQMYREDGRLAVDLPFRNGVILSAAASLCEQEGGGIVWLGTHTARSLETIPDTTQKFVLRMREAIFLGTGGKVDLIAPFAPYYKQDIVIRGQELKTRWELTFSCYESADSEHCHKCLGCEGRRTSFERAQVEDPLHV